MKTGQFANMLIVDGDESQLVKLKGVMEREGYRVITGANGEEGLHLAIEAQPDIILCEVTMPPADGLLLKKLLNEDKRTENIPFIFLAGQTSELDRITGSQMGVDADYLTHLLRT
jgi:DNA-binding response OmpR family regulator